MRILVAEDEKNLNRILTEALTDEGYSVDPCFDGQEAWDALACAEYDVLVLDIMMPRMDGFTALRRMRERGDMRLPKLAEMMIKLDGKMYTVVDATDEGGVYTITLEANRSR